MAPLLTGYFVTTIILIGLVPLVHLVPANGLECNVRLMATCHDLDQVHCEYVELATIKKVPSC